MPEGEPWICSPVGRSSWRKCDGGLPLRRRLARPSVPMRAAEWSMDASGLQREPAELEGFSALLS